MRKLHRVRGSSLSSAPKGSCIAEHFGQWNEPADNLGITQQLHISNVSPAAVNVSDYVAYVVLGGDDFETHQWLENCGSSTSAHIAKTDARRNLEREFR